MNHFKAILIFTLTATIGLSAQNTISGIITNKKENPLIGASVFIQGTYDGTTTDAEGKFTFETVEIGKVTLEISYIGYENKVITDDAENFKNLYIILRESTQSMDAVVVSASTFTAGDASKMTALNSLDIVTTAGSNGNVIAALQTLPGTQENSIDGRLIIRGGSARETSIYIDGLKVFSPYTRTIQGTPSRGRYSPFLFKGLSFNTGAYSAEYGEALSGILNMKTIDEVGETETNISLMTVGLGVGHTQKFDDESISLNLSYTDLEPYNAITSNRKKWINHYSGLSGEAIYRNKGKNSLFKTYIAGDTGGFELVDDRIDYTSPRNLNISNNNLYSNLNYTYLFNKNNSLFAGVSVGYNYDRFTINDSLQTKQKNLGIHAKTAMKSEISDRLILNYGMDYLVEQYHQKDILLKNDMERSSAIDDRIWATFAEADYYFNKNTAIQLGLRSEYAEIRSDIDLLPRISLSQKVGKKGQLTWAYGAYDQEIKPEFRYMNTALLPEKAEHYVMSYNYKSKAHTIRAEGYVKTYDDLLNYKGGEFNPLAISNDGDGYAYGIDIFWRSKELIDFMEFWISYGWLKSERNFRNYPTAATAPFSTEHNLSVVTKRWIEPLNSQLGISYSFATGRPYENPNTIGFMNETSKSYHNINLSWSYLITQQQILFASVSNPFNIKNEFGYRYAQTPDMNGMYPGEVIRPNTDQFFFIGYFLTISENKNKNQLDKL